MRYREPLRFSDKMAAGACVIRCSDSVRLGNIDPWRTCSLASGCTANIFGFVLGDAEVACTELTIAGHRCEASTAGNRATVPGRHTSVPRTGSLLRSSAVSDVIHLVAVSGTETKGRRIRGVIDRVLVSRTITGTQAIAVVSITRTVRINGDRIAAVQRFVYRKLFACLRQI